MQKLLFTAIIIIGSLSMYGQSLDAINAQLNTLKSKKSDLQLNIKKLQSELQEVNSEIASLEEKRKSIEASSSSGGTIVATVNSLEGILRDKPSSLGTELARIKEGEKIVVHREHQGLYFKVTYLGKTGYLNYSSITSNPEIDKLLTEGNNNTTNNNTSVTVVRNVDTSDPKYQRLEKIYGKEKAIMIMNGELWEGMSHGMVLESLGKPSSKSSKNTLDGLQETWTFPGKELTFLNGELKDWTGK